MRSLTSGAVLLMAALVAPAAAQDSGAHAGHAGMEHAAAPTEGLRAELVADVEQMEQKYVSLAEAMTAHLDWRPGEGVRSVREVFEHVASANFMIPSMAGVEREMAEQHVDEASGSDALVDGLKHSFMHAKHAIAQVPDSELEDMVTMFGREATKRQVLTLLVTHMHEHLGQSIAYARANGVTPPWSE